MYQLWSGPATIFTNDLYLAINNKGLSAQSALFFEKVH